MSTIPFALPADPLLGGSLSTGLTGLPKPLPMGLPGGSALSGLPYAQPITSLASQVPRGVGAEALSAANALRGGAVATGGGGGGGGGLLSSLPGIGSIARGPNTWSTLGKGAKFTRGLGAGVLGEVGSRLVDATNIGGQNSNLEQGLQGAAQGAAAGALIGAPFFGVGAGVGAAVGGALGGAVGVLANTFGLGGDGGEEEAAPDPVKILANAINVAELDPATTEEILDTYDVMIALAAGIEDEDQRALQEAAALEQAGQMVLAALGQREQVSSQATNTLALQAQAQDIFAPLAQDITDSSMLYANAMKGIRDTLPESYRPIADATVARELSSAQRLASAYQAQAAVTPVINRLTQYQQDYNNLAAQQFSQALAQQAAGGSASLGGSTSDVLAALTP